MQTNKSYIEKIDAWEANAVATLAKFGPWFITLPTAWAIGEAAIGHFGWPWWMGGLTGLGIEILGVVVNYTALELFAHNQSRDENEPGRPFLFSAALAAVYFGAVIVLTAVVENDWLLAAFPILSLVGGVTIGLRIQHGALKLKHAAKVQADNDEKDRRKAKDEADKAKAEADKAQADADAQAAKFAEAERKRAERAAKEAAKVAEKAQETAQKAQLVAPEVQSIAPDVQEIAEPEASFLGLRHLPRYEEFVAAMEKRNGTAPDSAQCIAGIQELGKSKRTAQLWVADWKKHKEAKLAQVA